jgi:hypothetical protein
MMLLLKRELKVAWRNKLGFYLRLMQVFITDAYYLLLLPSYSASLVEEWEINNHPKKINLYKKKRIEVGYVKFVKEN